MIKYKVIANINNSNAVRVQPFSFTVDEKSKNGKYEMLLLCKKGFSNISATASNRKDIILKQQQITEYHITNKYTNLIADLKTSMRKDKGRKAIVYFETYISMIKGVATGSNENEIQILLKYEI